MARILAISSQVARGHVGLSAIVPALQAMGHEVIGLPTVLLSNHPGHPHVAGLRIPPADLERMRDALAANGWLAEVDTVLTGYQPSAEHVAFAAETIALVRAAGGGARVVVDPVLGDAPKGLYVDPAAATAIRDRLLPLADVATPNRFELGWLTGRQLTDVASVTDAARALDRPAVVVTSAAILEPRSALPACPPLSPPREGEGEGHSTAAAVRAQQEIMSLLVTGTAVTSCKVPFRSSVPNGTGDLLAGLIAGHLVSGHAIEDAFARAIAGVEAVVAASVGQHELALAASLPQLTAASWPLEPVT